MSGDGVKEKTESLLGTAASGDSTEPTVHAATPIEQFGQDHWSTFAYIETCCVDGNGMVRNEKMRCDPARHPSKAHAVSFLFKDEKYPTRLRNGVERHEHDDWDCVDDLEACGLLVWGGTGAIPRFSLTERGLEIVAQLRRHKALGGSFSTFVAGDREGASVGVKAADALTVPKTNGQTQSILKDGQ